MNDYIVVQGARQHNLKNVSINIPKNKLVVITGPSGSGKSSLAFDTIYAESQRRYVESLSSYARQFLNLQDKPEVDSITGLSPSIAIDQKAIARNPRSTVSTITEIYDYLRILFARIGIAYSPATGLPIEKQSSSDIVQRVKTLPEGTKVYILAPIIRGQRGEHRKELAGLQKQGFVRVKLDSEIMEIADAIHAIDKSKKHDIQVVIDRIEVDSELGNRLADSVESGMKVGNGLLFVEIVSLPEGTEHVDLPFKKNVKTGDILVFSEKFSCPVSDFTIEEIEPRLFSFNSPYGACKKCNGLGTEYHFAKDLIVPDPSLSLEDGAVSSWRSQPKYYSQIVESLAEHYKFDCKTPFEKLGAEIQDLIFHGSKGKQIKMKYNDGFKTSTITREFEGAISILEKQMREADSEFIAESLEQYQSLVPCLECGGHRLKKEALQIKIAEKNIGEVCSFSITEAIKWFNDLTAKLSDTHAIIAERPIKEIGKRLGFLNNVGIEYLTLNRESGTLSGGEAQRIRLASQIGSGLSGVIYVLDEPSIGLHQDDNSKLIKTMQDLRDLGNTVIVVEHDEETMLAADYLIDIGPEAGAKGGFVVAEGLPKEVMENENSITGKFLSGKEKIDVPTARRRFGKNEEIVIKNARSHNLKNVTCKIPLGLFVAVTGVSGGGKSSLIIDTLYKALAKKLNHASTTPGPHEEITGIRNIDKVIQIDQSPIGRTPRSNPATYTAAFNHIRDWFASLPESKMRGYTAGRFSFNTKGGRCESCQGDGLVKIEMHFLPDVYVNCEFCKGKRYNRETLEIEYKGRNISDILNMTVEEAYKFFHKIPAIKDKMKSLYDVGLGYIKIGQSATTLSGGEAQRIKLSRELSKRATGNTLYILDEPTTGLHSSDIRRLLKVLHTLVDYGNTVLVIEHNIDVIKTADYVIDIGPRGGVAGGKIVAEGTPEDIAACKASITGKYLKKVLSAG